MSKPSFRVGHHGAGVREPQPSAKPLSPHDREILADLQTAMSESDVVRAVREVLIDQGLSFALGNERPLPLSDHDVTALQCNGNTAENWSHVWTTGSIDARRIRGCRFLGRVVFGRFDQRAQIAKGVGHPTGLYHSALANCVIGHNVLVNEVRWLHGYTIAPGAVVWDVGALACNGPTSFGMGQELPLAVETGARAVRVFPEITIALAALIARRRGDRDFIHWYGQEVQRLAEATRSPLGIVEAGAMIFRTGRVVDTYVGPGCRIENATAVLGSTLLSQPEQPTLVGDAAHVENALLQWGAAVRSGGIVQRSVLAEQSSVERQGKVSDSIIGPNSVVAKGEVCASLVGPFVSMNHQSLLIAALWPEGKGNVSAGANVGSNHTSKLPDQEMWAGEGVFFGLGVNVKYPTDLSRAPYTLLASGITTLPQKMTFPFSLINSPAARFDEISPAYNEIIPAWMLTDNLYALLRNEHKFRTRNQARRSRFACEFLRPEIVELMVEARRRLQEVRSPREFYTEHDITGLGKNYLRESHRKLAIDGYHFFIAYYALRSLNARVASEGDLASAAGIVDDPSSDWAWEAARKLLEREHGVNPWLPGRLEEQPADRIGQVAALLNRFCEMQEAVAQAVEESRRRDDERGIRIIDDYAEAHDPAHRDPVVQRAWAEAQQTRQEVETLLARAAAWR